MLICPQCVFENPEANKFCQNCGVSLTHKTCDRCQENIPIKAKVCSSCGAVNQTVLWAIISQSKAKSKYQSEFDELPSRSVNRPVRAKIGNLFELFGDNQSTTGVSLQLQTKPEPTKERYILKTDKDFKPLFQNIDSSIDSTFIQGRAIDRYPWQISYLATLKKEQMDVFAELKHNLNSSYLSVTQYWNLLGLPTHALPYLILEKYTPKVPKIYDAWQQQDRGIVLLYDRSQWQLMTDLWLQQELPILQIVWFLDEIAKLWSPLQQVSCAQSLLIDENLCIDEDQAVCLKQLYINSEVSPTLSDLARTWQDYLTRCNLDNLDNLERLLNRVVTGEITQIEQLRSQLQVIGSDSSAKEFSNIDRNSNSMNTFPSESKPEFEHDFFVEHDEEQNTAIISMRLDALTVAGCTNVGTQRDRNEDYFGIKTLTEKIENNSENDLNVRGLYIVCDGMGGHSAGEIASAMAVTKLQQYFETNWRSQLPDRNTIEEGILLANQALYQTNLNNSRSGSGRMGTTLVMALLQDTQCAIAHVGDSRIYRIGRQRGLEQLTLDHEVGQREINRGVEPDIAYGRPDAYQLTQALGPRDNNSVRPEIQSIEITEDCLLLLCSDGLSDNQLIEQNWSQYLKPLISSKNNLQEGLFKFVELANERNGHDNITSVLIRIKLKPNL
jgi:protein phosphatase